MKKTIKIVGISRLQHTVAYDCRNMAQHVSVEPYITANAIENCCHSCPTEYCSTISVRTGGTQSLPTDGNTKKTIKIVGISRLQHTVA
jgi:hypothetical protein